MTNDEIRLKIAKLKGIDPSITEPNDDGNFVHKKHIPNWPESIEDAVSLFNDVKSDIHIKREFGMWQVIISSESGRGFAGKNESLPVAICEAYIPWKES